MADTPPLAVDWGTMQTVDSSKLPRTAFFYGDYSVDVAAVPVKASVIRDGWVVPDVKWNTAVLDGFVGSLMPIVPNQEPRIISQKIAPGTKVQPGTTVDLVLAYPATIPLTLFDNVHAVLKDKTIADVTGGILANSAIRNTLLKYDSAAAVTAEDKATLTAAFNTAGITINEANANTSFAAAFGPLLSAAAFV